MNEIPKLISVRDAFFAIDETVNKAVPRLPTRTIEEFFAPPEDIDDSLRHEKQKYIFVDDSRASCGSVWQRSVDIMWSVCSSVDRFFVAKAGQIIDEVSTLGFGSAPSDDGLSNDFFNILSGKTVTGGFEAHTEAGNRAGSLGETVFLAAEEYNATLTTETASTVDHRDIRSLQDAYQLCVFDQKSAPTIIQKKFEEEFFAVNMLHGKQVVRTIRRELWAEFAPSLWKKRGPKSGRRK